MSIYAMKSSSLMLSSEPVYFKTTQFCNHFATQRCKNLHTIRDTSKVLNDLWTKLIPLNLVTVSWITSQECLYIYINNLHLELIRMNLLSLLTLLTAPEKMVQQLFAFCQVLMTFLKKKGEKCEATSWEYGKTSFKY